MTELKPVTFSVHKYVKNNITKEISVQKDYTVDLNILPFEYTTANVTYSQKRTISLANYESASVMCSVTLPCYVEGIEIAKRSATQFISKWMEDEVDEIETSAGLK